MRYLAIEEYGDRTQGVFEELTDQILTPLLRLNDGTVVAGLAKTEEGHPLLLLPEWTPNKRAWLLAAWRTWVGDKSMLAPPPPSGYEVEAWMTAAELDVHDQIVARQDELSALRDRLEGEIAELTEDLTATSSAAAVGFRRLLTAQGDPLVAAVEEALGLFEFRVQNMDEVFEEKREDLRVEEPDESWTALVEVKGYTKAGKANDFSKFTKHTRLFMSEQGRAPNACWYVINAYCGQAPAARPGPFDSSQDAVKHFAEYADGLVVPTTELFKLVRDVQRGDRTPHEARTLLLNAREQFKHAPAASVAALPLPDGER